MRRTAAFGATVLYITQLLGLALGLSNADVGLDALTVSAEPLLAGIGV